ncbi:MAG: hypothetical protein ACE5ID_09835 [Acidobacteriota bacterium]
MLSQKSAVKLHENLVLLEVEAASHLKELEALPQVRRAVVRRLNPTTVVLDPDLLGEMLEALERHGFLPRLESGDGTEP